MRRKREVSMLVSLTSRHKLIGNTYKVSGAHFRSYIHCRSQGLPRLLDFESFGFVPKGEPNALFA